MQMVLHILNLEIIKFWLEYLDLETFTLNTCLILIQEFYASDIIWNHFLSEKEKTLLLQEEKLKYLK